MFDLVTVGLRAYRVTAENSLPLGGRELRIECANLWVGDTQDLVDDRSASFVCRERYFLEFTWFDRFSDVNVYDSTDT